MIDAPTHKNGALACAAARFSSIAAGSRREEAVESQSRRRIAALGLTALPPLGARAEPYPSKPIRMIVPYAPGGTPKPIVTQLHQAVAQVMAMPDVRERLLTMNYISIGGPPEHLASAMVAETAGWAKVVKDTGFKVD